MQTKQPGQWEAARSFSFCVFSCLFVAIAITSRAVFSVRPGRRSGNAGFAGGGLLQTRPGPVKVGKEYGPDAPALNLALFRQMQNKPTGPLSWFGGELDDADFVAQMEAEHRLIYEFDVHHAYGLH